ncbi:TetR/AcrR family transcriptional regulator [Streptomyces sp. NPDC048430]|uniref:TetR/AcrR family transcriptional regulator n=1 Tax=Streptomyces sp. NPDC048430 TaxID=3155388 RepID=UPI0034152367
MAAPATPSTQAQRERYGRVVQAATSTLSAGGEDALQMKELAQKADVSLATLYRYFPSKDHVLLAIAVDHYDRAYRRVLTETPSGRTVRERVTNQLLREFRAGQRNQRLTAALSRALTETSSHYSEVIEHLENLQTRIRRVVAEADGPISEQQRRVLPIIGQIFVAASRRWLAGIASASDARFQITVGCRLLDVADELVDEDEDAAHATSADMHTAMRPNPASNPTAAASPSPSTPPVRRFTDERLP